MLCLDECFDTNTHKKDMLEMYSSERASLQRHSNDCGKSSWLAVYTLGP